MTVAALPGSVYGEEEHDDYGGGDYGDDDDSSPHARSLGLMSGLV